MEPQPYVAAPRWRVAASAIVDMFVVGGAWTLARRRGWVGGGGRGAGLVGISGDAIRAQLRTPGQRLLGLRTVDERTGRRVVLWRTLVLLGVASAGHALERRGQPQLGGGLSDVGASHTDPPAREDETARVLAEGRPEPFELSLQRAMVSSLAVALVNNRLRRRLAPTLEVLVRRPRDHKP